MTTTTEPAQLGLDGMPTRLFSCTPSRLATWLDCPRRYKFVYVDRPSPPKGPPWAHNSVGAAVHGALAAWFGFPVDERTPSAAAAVLRERWIPLGFKDDAQSAVWRERAAQMVERYVATLDPHLEPVGVERTVAVRTDHVALSGRIDRLDRRGDELVVVDYKTGRHVLTADDARGSMALAVYALAAARTLRRRCVRVELHHLPTGSVVSWDHTEESLQRQLRRIEDIAADVVAAEARGPDHHADAFAPRPGPMCGWCDFAAHCPEGRAARASYLTWAGLAEDLEPPAVAAG
jgi:RecB family exonuclease